MTDIMKKSLVILEKTNDGDDLAPHHLTLVELAVNGFLNEQGKAAFEELYRNVLKGYTKPWFHGIEHLTIDHDGYVYWKGQVVEHFELPFAYTERAREAALEVARRCRILEEQGEEINTTSVIWNWPDEEGDEVEMVRSFLGGDF